MRRSMLVSVAAGAVIAAALGGTASAEPAQESGGYIVVLKDGTAPGQVAGEHGRRYGADVDHVYRHALKGYSAQMSPVAAARLAEDDRVLFVQPDGVVHATKPGQDRPGGGKPDKPGDGGTESPATQTTPTGILRIGGELSSTASGNGAGAVDVDVAVLDSGVDLDHPDLNVYAPGAVNFSSGSSADDGNGHGTHVAGTIGALDDGKGVVGVAPGARIWPIRVLDNRGNGTFSGIIAGIDYVTGINTDSDPANDIEVANMSLGGTRTVAERDCNFADPASTTGDALHDAICRSVAAGVTYVVAAGNDAEDAENHVPAAYDEVITVSALADFDGKTGGLGQPTCRADEDDTLANFSNFGADVDLIAPGVCIDSTWKGGGYKTISGTSMASPHVAGAAALYAAAHLGASPAAVQSALQAAGTADWNNGDDRDGTKEPLLDVGGF